MIQETQAFLNFAQKQSPEFIQAQAQLEKKLTRLFKDVAREIDAQVKSGKNLTNIQTVSAPIMQAKEEFILLIENEIKSAPFIPASIQEKLKEQGEISAKKMLARMQNKVTKIVETAQAKGLGAKDITKDLSKVFTTMSEGQVKTIARNEMNLANALKGQQNFLDQGVQYEQWSSIVDDVTRDSHIDLDGEIIRIGDTFSNGLRYPHDHSGDIGEWINCRCDALPFIPPRGYFPPPGQEQFREEDLIKVSGLN